LTHTKTRERYFPGMTYQLVDSGDWNERHECSANLEFKLLEDEIVNKKEEMRVKILELLGNKLTPVSRADLMAACGGDNNEFSKMIKELVEGGFVSLEK